MFIPEVYFMWFFLSRVSLSCDRYHWGWTMCEGKLWAHS